MWIIWILIAVALVYIVYLYNRFVVLRNRTDEAWADIDVQLKRRYDLIPNLVSTVKGYAEHEKGTLDEVVEARSKATAVHVDPSNLSAAKLQEMSQAETGLSQALGKLFALSENYPDLKANENFLELQRELSDTENKIQAARRFYNANVRDLNTRVELFPSNVIANIFNFGKREFFDLEDDATARENVEVKF